MKEIILPTEEMAFFLVNMFGHDSALHDFTLSSELGKGRVLEVLRTSTPPYPGTETWIAKGGGDEGDKALNDAIYNSYMATVGPTLYKCLESTGFFDISRNDTTRSDSFIIVDAKLAMGVIFKNLNVSNMGIAPGFIYLPEKTYSPFEFVVINRSPTLIPGGYAADSITYQHYSSPLAIQINRVGPSFNCMISRNGVVTSYNLLSSREALVRKASEIIATNPDVSDAFMSMTATTNIRNYIDYIDLLLDGAEARYTFILKDYIEFGCCSDDEKVGVGKLMTEGKNFLKVTINEFWVQALAAFNQALAAFGQGNVNALDIIPFILNKYSEIIDYFALIYKAILCSVVTAAKSDLYSCTRPSIAQSILNVKDLNDFYIDNQYKLEMFVVNYMVYGTDFNDEAAANLKKTCDILIRGINRIVSDKLYKFITDVGIDRAIPAILTRLQNLEDVYDLTSTGWSEIRDIIDGPSLQLFLRQYPVTYFVNIETTAETTDKISNVVDYTTFINFLQIVSDTLTNKIIEEKKIQEQKENEPDYVDNSTIKYKEDFIRSLTNLPIIKENPTTFNHVSLSTLIQLVQQTLNLLFEGSIQDPDYSIILSDAVGSVNVEGVKVLLLSGAGGVTGEQVPVATELLQTLFLDLINRLGSDQLDLLIDEYITPQSDLFGTYVGGKGQSGGAQKKPKYLFVFSDAKTFFVQLTNQNRLTKMKSKFKELFDTTDDLPAFYTDLIIKPNIPSALNWTINFNDVFLGFFPNATVTSENLMVSIESGVIFPQIPSTVIDDLTLGDVLTQNISLFQSEVELKITGLKTLGATWYSAVSRPATHISFQSIMEIIKDLKLPGIFVEPVEDSGIFWRFERGYIYLLKCVVLYNVLFFRDPDNSLSGCETLETNGFTQTCPIPDSPLLNGFLFLFFSCTNRYSELLTKIRELEKTGSVLSGPQKLCTGYALGCVLTSIMTEMDPIISSFKNSALLNIETNEIYRILAKKANVSTILQGGVFGDNDTKLYNKFINWVNNNNFQREDNTVFSHKENISGKLGESLSGDDGKWGDSRLVKDIMAQYGGNGKFYINNAVNAPSALGKLGRGYFCPAASIMDNQTTCSTKNSSEANEGFEVGVMDFVIHDGRPFGQQTGISPKMIYRVRVVPNTDFSMCKIGAYLYIEDKLLINVADADIQRGLEPNNWPLDPHPPIIVPLNSVRGEIIPMDAKTCLKNIFATIDSDKFKAYNGTGFQALIDDLEKSEGSELRRLILESSFVKGLGDFLQEATGFVDNSGYVGQSIYSSPTGIIRLPNEGRLQLNNDRPSSVRAILLVLYGKKDINPNVIAGFLTEMKDKKNIPKSKYALAGRLTSGGGRNTKKTKIIKRSKKSKRIKKSKQSKRSKRSKRNKRNKKSKRNKTTRKIKMKTRTNKRSK